MLWSFIMMFCKSCIIKGRFDLTNWNHLPFVQFANKAFRLILKYSIKRVLKTIKWVPSVTSKLFKTNYKKHKNKTITYFKVSESKAQKIHIHSHKQNGAGTTKLHIYLKLGKVISFTTNKWFSILSVTSHINTWSLWFT